MADNNRAITNKDLVEASKGKKTDNTKKKNRNPVFEAAEKDGVSMTYHGILALVKIFLIYRTVMAFASSFMSAASVYRTVDQIFYAVIIIVCVVSLIMHNRKAGAVALIAYMGLELAMELVIFYLAKTKGLDIPDLNTKMISTLGGISVWGVLTFLYYKKRWGYLL